jgi:hypothetical protein
LGDLNITNNKPYFKWWCMLVLIRPTYELILFLHTYILLYKTPRNLLQTSTQKKKIFSFQNFLFFNRGIFFVSFTFKLFFHCNGMDNFLHFFPDYFPSFFLFWNEWDFFFTLSKLSLSLIQKWIEKFYHFFPPLQPPPLEWMNNLIL